MTTLTNTIEIDLRPDEAFDYADGPPHSQFTTTRQSPIRPHAGIVIETLDDGARSRVTFELEFEGHGFGKALIPAVRQLAARGAPASHQRLKERLEARA